MSAEKRRSADPIFLDLTIQGPLADAEQFRGFLAVAGGELEGLGDVELLDFIERSADELARAGGPGFQRARRGGREILGLAGALVAAARARRPIVLDGVVVGAAALLAQAIAPESIGYCIAAHRSVERGHAIALRALGLRPLFDLELRLGEASGAALALPFVESAARMLTEMYTFEEAGVALSVRS